MNAFFFEYPLLNAVDLFHHLTHEENTGAYLSLSASLISFLQTKCIDLIHLPQDLSLVQEEAKIMLVATSGLQVGCHTIRMILFSAGPPLWSSDQG
jgi:hypothetical protein